MTQRTEKARSQTIVRRVSGVAGSERFCVLHEAVLPATHAFVFTCVADGLTVAQVCEELIRAGISEPDVYRLLDEARAGYLPYSQAGA